MAAREGGVIHYMNGPAKSSRTPFGPDDCHGRILCDALTVDTLAATDATSTTTTKVMRQSTA
jgi:hypothetical protein